MSETNSFWQTTTTSEPLTLEKLKGMWEKLVGPETLAAERERIMCINKNYINLKNEAEKAGMLENHSIQSALAYVSLDMPVSPQLYNKVKELLGYG